jgi:hypothetical protein
MDDGSEGSSSAATIIPPKSGTTILTPKKIKLQDYDGDGKADLVVYRPTENNWYVHPSKGGADMVANWGYPSDRMVPGDYDGDGKTDFAVWRPSEGNWYVIGSSVSIPTAQWGVSTDLPVPGDYDGDGKQDFAVFRPSEGNWYVWSSKAGSAIVKQFGYQSDHPVPGDYDGDGKTDYAYFRPSTGQWHILSSRTGTESITDWGDGNDTMVPADYDGDGKTDIALFRPYEGNWYVIPSKTGVGTSVNWGFATDRVVPGDYDGDGKADYAVYRPSEGNWYVLSSKSGGSTTTQFGTSSDFIPYHLFAAQCGGFNQRDQLMSPYHCSLADFKAMVTLGWPADSRRRNIVYRGLTQVPTLPSVNQPEYDYVAAIGKCDSTAQSFYDAGSAWCSEFVRYVYRNGGVPDVKTSCGILGCSYLHDVDQVSDFTDLFKAYGGYFTPASIQEPQPGDYIAAVNSEGQHFGHSQMVIGVWDDQTNIETLGGNQSFPINGTTHHCVTMRREAFYNGTSIVKQADAFGNVLKFF